MHSYLKYTPHRARTHTCISLHPKLECDDFSLNNEPHIVCRVITNQKHPVSLVTCLFNLLCACDHLQPHQHTGYVKSSVL